jgi:hypothetical protein
MEALFSLFTQTRPSSWVWRKGLFLSPKGYVTRQPRPKLDEAMQRPDENI